MKVVALLRDQFGGHGVVRHEEAAKAEGDEPSPAVHAGDDPDLEPKP